MSKIPTENEFKSLIASFDGFLNALKESKMVSMDFAGEVKNRSKTQEIEEAMKDSFMDFVVKNQGKMNAIMKIGKIFQNKSKTHQRNYLVIRGEILGEAVGHQFRPFRIFFPKFTHYLKDNLIIDRVYFFTDLAAKLLPREQIKRELVFQSTNSSKGFFTKIIPCY